MASFVGIVAGLAVIGGTVAVSRAVRRQLKDIKKAFKASEQETTSETGVLDYEKDPTTGVFRPKID